MTDVVEVWNITVCNIILITVSVPNHLTHIPQEVVVLLLADNLLAPKILSIIAHTNSSTEPQLLNQLVTFNQFLLPLMPKVGQAIVEVSSPTVEPLKITPSY